MKTRAGGQAVDRSIIRGLRSRRFQSVEFDRDYQRVKEQKISVS